MAAAAYASLVSLFNTLEDIQNHPSHSSSFDSNQIQSLLENICFLIDFMETCDNSPASATEAAQVLERRIARAVHSAEEVIESHLVDQILGGKTTSGFLLDLQNAVEEMDFVRRKAVKVRKTQSGMEAEQPAFSAAAALSTPPASVKNKMMGFDGILFQLMDLLTGESSSRRVVPIVGMGGIGKTTLAENAFHRNSFVRHFDVRVWVTISQQYSVKEILSQLLSRQGMSTVETVDELGEQLHKKLLGRRYLIVLDDVWGVEAWDRIRLLLPDDGISGSRVVVTTRLQSVADCFASPCLAMKFLDDEKSWDLFCEKAFAERGCPPELEGIGKKIVKKCNGLPLAIVVIAGHLGKASMTLEYWENVANHMNSILKYGENEEQLLNMLSLSYSHLPVHLKPCFLYIGTFPGVGWISMSDVIELWIAEGFLKPNKAQTLEKVAEGYLKDLIARNLILVSRSRFSNGETGSCKTHDVLRELCLKIVEKEKFFLVLHTSRAAVRWRFPSHVRSLKYVGGQLPFDLKLSRVLINKVDKKLANEADGGFLEANFQQVNLRYLHCLKVDANKSRGSLSLSPTISLLWTLQTIIIKGFYPLVIAPYEIWEMLQLRVLQFRRVSLPDPLPSHRANDPVLQNLHTLHRAQNFKLSEEVCKRIPNIMKLSLSYHNFEKVCDEPKSHYCPNNLDRLHKLESLACYFSAEREWRDFALSLTLPSSLKDLTLSNSRFDWEELTRIVGSLPCLEILSVNSVTGSEWTPVHGKFLHLRKLTIQGCDDLVYWNAERSHFPMLEYVDLQDLSKLDEFPSGIGEIATIRYMALRLCSVSSAVSAMRMLTEQVEELGNEDLQLEVNFSGDNEKLESFYEQVEDEFLRINNVRLVT